MTMPGARCWVLGAVAMIFAAAGVADAQVPRPQPRPRRAKTLSFGGVWIAPLSLGSATAGFERPDGSQLVVFRAENDLSMGLGLEASFGVELNRNFWLEITGGWVRSDLRTRVSDDVESVPTDTLTEALSRFSVEGSALWYFRTRARTGYFVRGGAGWMRELTGGASLAEDGIVANGGLGVRHWWRDNPRGSFRRVGFRAEFRLNVRSKSLSQVESKLRISPAGAGLLVIGF
jgi:hypothetical protein